MKKRRTLLAIPLVLALFGLSAASCTPRDLATSDCLSNANRPAPIVIGTSGGAWPTPEGLLIPNDTPIDARGVVRVGSGTGVTFKLNNIVGSRNNVCIVGGSFTSDNNVLESWTGTWHHQYGFRVEAPNSTIIGVELRNLGDGIDYRYATATNWKVIGVRADNGGDATHTGGAFIHDDCVQNDTMQSGLITDSKFDGCASFLSSIHDPSSNPIDGSGNTVTVEGSLVRLMDMPGTYEGGSVPPGKHGGFFKFATAAVATPEDDGTPPHLVLRDSMFRSDERAYFGGAEGNFLGLPLNTVCDNVVVVGWDSWQQRDRDSWVQECGPVGVVTPGDDDNIPNLQVGTITDWNTAVTAWDDAHPALVRP